MSEADKLLDSLDEGNVENDIVEEYEEPHIIINSDRTITVPPELKEIAVQFDHDIETVTFDCPRYWDGWDMFNMNIHINYMTPDGKVHYYIAKDKILDKDDDSIIHFTWTISRNVTENKGNIKFLVCIKNVNESGEEINHWNSKINTDLHIAEGMESDNAEVIDKYPDIIEGLLMRMNELENIGLSTIIDIQEIDNGHEVSITSIRGVTSFKVVNGAVFTPIINSEGDLSWINNGDLNNPPQVNIKGPKGEKGESGSIFTKVDLEEGKAEVNPFKAYRIKTTSTDPSIDLKKEDPYFRFGSIAMVGNNIYSFGGSSPDNKSNLIQMYDIDNESVITLEATLNEPVGDVAAVAVGKKIYLFGGGIYGVQNGSYKTYAVNTIQVFDTENGTIKVLDTVLPTALYSIAAAAVENDIYLFGGFSTPTSYSNNVYKFDAETEKIRTVNNITVPNRLGFSKPVVTSIDRKIYLTYIGIVDPNVYLFDTDNTYEGFQNIGLDYLFEYPDEPISNFISMGNKLYLFGTNSLCIVHDLETGITHELDMVIPYSLSDQSIVVKNKILFFNSGSLSVSGTILVFSDTDVSCYLSINFENVKYNLTLINAHDEYRDSFLFELLSIKVSSDAKDLMVVYEVNGNRMIEKFAIEETFDLSKCKLCIEGAEQVLKYNTEHASNQIIAANFIKKDEDGGNIYELTFDNGCKVLFTAPKGEDAKINIVRLI